MRTRLVVWGINENDEKVLLAVALNADNNKVEIWSIPESTITEEFYNQMMSQWRDGSDLELPASAQHRITELTMADSILPDDLKVERSDVIQRAQMEWHFIILSTKLYKNFKTELEDISDKVKRLESFDQAVWDELKELWSNVQKHIFDKNILRDHADSLREKSNALFDELKKLRKNLNSELNQKSKEASALIIQKLTEINEKIEAGALLKPLFDQLIGIQKELKNHTLVRPDRELLMSRINESFKLIREKREQHDSSREKNRQGGSDQLTRRYEGLLVAIKKMEQSIDFEKRNIDFENRRIQKTSGQLEAQIRVAKIKMIEERIRSKEEKLKDLLLTKDKLEVLTQKIQKRQERIKQKQEHEEKLEAEKEKVMAKITDEIHQVHEQIPEEVQEKLTQAAEDIKSAKKPQKAATKKPKVKKDKTQDKIETTEENTTSEDTSQTIPDIQSLQEVNTPESSSNTSSEEEQS
jgi:hypothetical protein